MADTILLSTTESNMVDYPLAIQASGADPVIEYGAQEHMRHLIDALMTASGRCTPTSFVVTQRAAGANFSVDVSAGYLVVTGSTAATTQGKYLVKLTAFVNVATPTPPGSGVRFHRVVAQVNDKAIDGGSAYGWRLWLMEDTGSGTPAIPANAHHVAIVAIAAGQASVLNANIANNEVLATPWHNGAWISYTPTWVMQTSNGTKTGKYSVNGKKVTVKADFVGTASVALGTGFITFSLPFTAASASTGFWTGVVSWFESTSGFQVFAVCQIAGGGSVATIYGVDSGSAKPLYKNPGTLGYTLVPTDIISATITYERA